MGLERGPISFLGVASRHGVDFERTLMIGRQRVLTGPRTLRAALRDGGIQVSRAQTLALLDGSPYAERLLQRLGASIVDSLDGSDYEGATIIHDLNVPVSEESRARFSAVVECGTLEHVFNTASAAATCLECVALGGHYLAITPTNGYTGHGFYQFSPEFFCSTLAEENGFAIRCMLWRSEVPGGRWYQVADPDRVGRRVERLGYFPPQLFVAAQRTDLRRVLSVAPQQSDYVETWARAGAAGVEHRFERAGAGALRSLYERAPGAVKLAWRWSRWGGQPPMLEELRRFRRAVLRVRAHPEDFRRVSLSDVRWQQPERTTVNS